MLIKIKILLFILLFSLLQSCELKDPEVTIPSYITVTDATVKISDPNIQGTANDDIVDLWFYVDNNLKGIYTLPSKFPVLATGNQSITFRAQIKDSGQGAKRVLYPFYKPFDITLPLSANNNTPINPEFEYYSDTQFPLKEDFELGNLFVRGTNSDTVIFREKNTSNVFEGNASGLIYLDADMDFFLCETATTYFNQVPTNKPVFLEMNYKNNVEFSVGMFANSKVDQQVLYTIAATENWKKIYLNLTPFLAFYLNASNFQLFISVNKTSGAPGYVYLDNIKLVHN